MLVKPCNAHDDRTSASVYYVETRMAKPKIASSDSEVMSRRAKAVRGFGYVMGVRDYRNNVMRYECRAQPTTTARWKGFRPVFHG